METAAKHTDIQLQAAISVYVCFKERGGGKGNQTPDNLVNRLHVHVYIATHTHTHLHIYSCHSPVRQCSMSELKTAEDRLVSLLQSWEVEDSLTLGWKVGVNGFISSSQQQAATAT